MKITVDNKCPSCGANVKFNPTTQKWDCEYCGSSYDISEFEKQQEKCLTGFFCCAIVKNAILWQDMPTMLMQKSGLML